MGIVHINIDGVSLEAETGSMIIEVADEAGITIPRFCYHKKLSVAANCRMCLVDVSNSPKAVPACATPVAEGMTILTDSPKARMAQKSVMEFLLINHPLDCPICDQGGECELQDLAMGYGSDVSRFSEKKRVVHDKDIGPLIQTDMTRCIHCTRCVRFGTEIAGVRELGATGRGEHMEIGTFVAKSVDSEVSGNVIDLCPVGALTAKPSLYQARAWELQSTPSIAPHDALGSHIDIHHRRGQVIRIVPREEESINEVWLSDRDRFSYEALSKAERLTEPMIKRSGEWETCDWETALQHTVNQFQTLITQQGIESVGALVSPSATTEEMFLTQKMIRGLGCHNIDHRLRHLDFSKDIHEPVYPKVHFPLEDLEYMDATLLIDAHLRTEQPLLALRLRKSTFYGQVMVINSFESGYNFKLSVKIKTPPDELLSHLHGVVAELVRMQHETEALVRPQLKALFANIESTDEQKKIAHNLKYAENACVLVGQAGMEHSHGNYLRWLAYLISSLSRSQYGELSSGANSAGGHIAGVLPHRMSCGVHSDIQGFDVKRMLQQGLSGYLLMNTEPELDSSYQEMAEVALLKAETVVMLTPFAQGAFLDYADVLLPIAAFSETSGTYINAEGKWQSFAAAVAAPGSARPAWKVLRVLGNLFGISGFEYQSSEEIREELKTQLDNAGDLSMAFSSEPEHLLEGGENPKQLALYDIDPLVRRAPSLQKTIWARKNWRREKLDDLFNRSSK